jgi:hypothetical protein
MIFSRELSGRSERNDEGATRASMTFSEDLKQGSEG